MAENPFIGSWTYSSLLNDPKPSTPFDQLEFELGTMVTVDGTPELLSGTIGGQSQTASSC